MLELGFSSQEIRTRLDRDEWSATRRGVYRLTTAPATWRQALVGAYLTGGELGFISHRSAAALHQLPGFAPGPIEITTPRRIRGIRDMRVYRAAKGPIPSDVQTLGPVAVSTPTRTLIDVAGLVADDVLEEALDDAIRRGLTSAARMRWRIDSIGARGRPGVGILRGLVGERLLDQGPRESVLETRFLRLLKKHGLPLPVAQYEIWSLGKLVARVDFAYPALKLAIEVDGYRFHSGRMQWERDLKRRNRLESLGWRVFNVTALQLDEPAGGLRSLL